MRQLRFFLAVMSFIISTTLVTAQEDNHQIIMQYESLHPEGIEYYDGVIFVSSLTEGDVFRVEMDGTITQFTDDERLVSSNGLWVDEENGRLLVANSDVGVSYHSSEKTSYQLSALGVYDLTTGETLDYYDLSDPVAGSHFANDITMDDAGNIYVTDSFSPVIYRIDAHGEATIWLSDDTFAGEGFQLNGIVYHSDNYLLVSRSATGELYKIPLENPTAFSLINVDPIIGADGLEFDEEEIILYVVTGEGAYAVESSDDWRSATVTGVSSSPELGTYTTGTTIEGSLWVVNSRFDVLFNTDADTVQEFDLTRIIFDEAIDEA